MDEAVPAELPQPPCSSGLGEGGHCENLQDAHAGAIQRVIEGASADGSSEGEDSSDGEGPLGLVVGGHPGSFVGPGGPGDGWRRRGLAVLATLVSVSVVLAVIPGSGVAEGRNYEVIAGEEERRQDLLRAAERIAAACDGRKLAEDARDCVRLCDRHEVRCCLGVEGERCEEDAGEGEICGAYAGCQAWLDWNRDKSAGWVTKVAFDDGTDVPAGAASEVVVGVAEEAVGEEVDVPAAKKELGRDRGETDVLVDAEAANVTFDGKAVGPATEATMEVVADEAKWPGWKEEDATSANKDANEAIKESHHVGEGSHDESWNAYNVVYNTSVKAPEAKVIVDETKSSTEENQSEVVADADIPRHVAEACEESRLRADSSECRDVCDPSVIVCCFKGGGALCDGDLDCEVYAGCKVLLDWDRGMSARGARNIIMEGADRIVEEADLFA